MGQRQSAKASSEEAPDRLKTYKALLDIAFLNAQMLAAPSILDLLDVLLGRAQTADLPMHRLDPWPKGEMNPHEAMQELERAVEIDDLGNVLPVGIPGAPPERYSSSGPFAYLARPEAKSLPRDPAFWEAYHYAVDRYREIYFGPIERGRPPKADRRRAEAIELRERGLSWRQIGIKFFPNESKDEQKRAAERIRKLVNRSPRKDASPIDPLIRAMRTCLMCLESAPARTVVRK